MKPFAFLSFLFISFFTFGQNVQVDSQTNSPQQLIEDILIGNDCISNVNVINVSGGNFNGTDQSYGYFNANGSNFPFQEGVVLSTGKLANVEGPNNSLSDDNAPNWLGDADLETVLNENNTVNATIIEFEFTSLATQISFRYLFASEEYQINNANTCQFSDLFGFLIRNINDSQFNNIALVPNTQTPVKVTTIHPNIPNGCPAENEAYFGSWNNASAPINFNGQTAVLTATANVVPGETYRVKLVIADEQNYRFDSAVFLEAGSFKLTTNLGVDRRIETNNPLCENETLRIDASQPNASSYKWFKDGMELLGETNNDYLVTESGIYSVETTLQNTCIAYGNITIEYTTNPLVNNTILTACDTNQDGLTIYNLYDATETILNNEPNVGISNFYNTATNAEQATNEITNPSSFENTIPQQIVYARVENRNGCFAIAEITLETSNNTVLIAPFEACNSDDDGFTSFNLDDLKTKITPDVPANASISFYKNLDDFFNETNEVNGIYNNIAYETETLYVKIKNGGDCYALSTVELKTAISPELSADETTTYCTNTFPSKKTINAGLQNGIGNNPSYQWFFNSVLLPDTTASIEINELGVYTVLVTFSNTCSASRDITVNPSNTATIDAVKITQATSNNTVEILVSGEGDYEYALETLRFQNNPVFTNIASGFYTVYVNDKNGCGIAQKTIAILGFPKYFTPNGDGINDVWNPYGVNTAFNTTIEIKIFNRYGKFITQINALKTSWDGTYQGNMLPNDDYWYIATQSDGSDYQGHFTLKR